MPYPTHAHKDELRRDQPDGKAVPSSKPVSWQEFFDLADRAEIPADFMDERADVPAQERKLF